MDILICLKCSVFVAFHTLDLFPCNGGILLLGLGLMFNSCIEDFPFVPPVLSSFIIHETRFCLTRKILKSLVLALFFF